MQHAVVALMSFFSAVDRPDVVAAKLPAAGFPEDATEAAFADYVLPANLRAALSWQAAGADAAMHDDDADQVDETLAHEEEDETHSMIRELG